MMTLLSKETVLSQVKNGRSNCFMIYEQDWCDKTVVINIFSLNYVRFIYLVSTVNLNKVTNASLVSEVQGISFELLFLGVLAFRCAFPKCDK